MTAQASLNTIRFYIILKQGIGLTAILWRLNTIRFYIILKLAVIFQEHVAV